MAHRRTNTTAGELSRILPHARVEALAREYGCLARQRKVDVWMLIWALVLGFQSGARRSIESVRQAYMSATGEYIARSSFYQRLSPRLAKLMSHLAQVALNEHAPKAHISDGYLSKFKELLALDSMIIRLHKMLAPAFPACSPSRTGAAAKLHLIMNIAAGSPNRVKLTSARTSDQRPWRRVGKWLQGCLLIMDLGYYAHNLFNRIDRNGGFFVSRMKSNSNPVIVSVNRKWRGRSVNVVGMKLQDALAQVERKILDVNVKVTFKRRTYRKLCSRHTRIFRAIAIRHEGSERYHLYITNTSPDMLAAEDITQTYALRWQIEILFKALSSHYHIRDISSTKQHVAECFIFASILTAVASQAIYRLIREKVDPERAMPLLRWASVFSRESRELLSLVLHAHRKRDQALQQLLTRNAPDPNVNRKGGRAIPYPLCYQSAR